MKNIFSSPYVTLLFTLIFTMLLTACGSPLLKSSKKDPLQSGNVSSGMMKPQTSEKKSFRATLNWTEGPHTDPKYENRIVIVLTDDQGERITLPETQTLFFYGWMPSMGHGSADDGFVEQIAPGVYELKEFYLPHGGDWDLYVQVLEGENVVDQTRISVILPNDI